MPGEYIVRFRDDVRDVPGLAHALARAHGGSVLGTFQYTIKGFHAKLPEAAVAGIARSPRVQHVTPNQYLYPAETQVNPFNWGLDRIDQRVRPLDQTYSFSYNGAGVDMYILDSGVELNDPEFTGRIVPGRDEIDGDNDASGCHPHGTWVAGVAAGSRSGVAKGARIIPVRVVDCNGNWIPNVPWWGNGNAASAIRGLDWVALQHAPGQPAVANFSLGTRTGQPAIPNLDDAVRRLIADGVVVVIAAHNDNRDACQGSPGRVYEALTVAASDINDNRWGSSNWGTCVDLYAPGVGINAPRIGDGHDFVDGTSFAAPHVAGIAARFLQWQNKTPAEVNFHVKSAATVHQIIGDNTSTPNLLAHWEASPPLANVTYQASVAGIGWQPWTLGDGYIAGTVGESRSIDGVRMIPPASNFNICYNIWQGGGWKGYQCDGNIGGSPGSGQRVEGIAIQLYNAPPGWRVCYNVHMAGLSWMDHVCDNSVAGTPGQGRSLQALRVLILPP